MGQRLWTKDFIFVTIVNLFMYLIHYMLIVTITQFTIDQYHASESMGGLAAGVFIIGMLGGRLGAGRIIDNLQPKNVLLGGVIASVLAIALYFAITNIWILMIVRLLHGIAFGFSSTATGTISSRIIPEERKGEGIGYYGLSVTLASAFGPFLGLVLNNNLGFSSIFAIGLVSIIISLIFSLFIKKLPMNTVSEDEEIVKPKGINAFLQKEALPISMVVVLVGVAYSSVLSFLSIYADLLHLVTASSFFFVVFAVATFVTRPFTGKVYDNFGENKVMYPVLVSFAIGLVILSMTHTPLALLVAAAFVGFGYGTIIPTAQAIAIQQSPASKMGLATSTFYIFVDFGAGMGPFILGLFIPYIGYRNLYLAMGVLLVIAIIVYFFVHGRHHKHPFKKATKEAK
ncbi:MFS transporter [Staphylococcus sp. NRL 16/872]|uniref:MFS transporter n=1 Tax=Staphylococcus sp. NRL 16/872 TaxID=2930131 RepID=UPI001FB52645|nr:MULTISPECIES: MFS transporter [unclassified Staphylococcus]MCJ1655283.1 MFS transporter [Staphylococcus sp. NRL 21/187]MCJ1661115.1 MFS transporter [Staphylococcus sp. NRL 18/288]MCJ1667012.1 MFS transporter [Staphylococcus sp. NRL 19/737]WEN69486.1 MFS transporter [Staphylococcus sp. NRL 16/872]